MLCFDAAHSAADYAAAFQAAKAASTTTSAKVATPATVGRPDCPFDPASPTYHGRQPAVGAGALNVEAEALLLDVRVREAAGLVAVLELAAKHYNDAYGELARPMEAAAWRNPSAGRVPSGTRLLTINNVMRRLLLFAVCIEVHAGKGMQIRAIDAAKVCVVRRHAGGEP